MTECLFCGDSLHSFVEEYDTVQGEAMLYIVLCPTCYLTYAIVATRSDDLTLVHA